MNNHTCAGLAVKIVSNDPIITTVDLFGLVSIDHIASILRIKQARFCSISIFTSCSGVVVGLYKLGVR